MAGRVRRVPQRTCIGCQEVAGKRTLLRIVRTPEGIVELDTTGKRSGRGAYVHLEKACLEKALKGQRLARALRAEIDGETAERLRHDLQHQLDRADLLARMAGGKAPGDRR